MASKGFGEQKGRFTGSNGAKAESVVAAASSSALLNRIGRGKKTLHLKRLT